MQEWLDQKVLWLLNKQWLAIVFCFLIAPLLSGLIKLFFKQLFLSRSKNFLESADKTLKAQFNKLLTFCFVFGSFYILLPYLDFSLETLGVLTKIASVVFGTVFFYLCFTTIQIVSEHFHQLALESDDKFDDMLVPMFNKAARVVLFCLIIVYLAKVFSIDITSIVAGLGIGGIAVAFAAKDSLANLFGSLMIILDKPFQIGDYIAVNGIEGSVVEVGFRSTRVRTFYDSLISIPNSLLSNTHVDNYGKRRYRRFKSNIGIEYDTPPEKIEAFVDGIRDIISKHPRTRKDVFHVYFNNLGSSSLDILIYMYWEVDDWSDELNERQRLLIDIMRLAREMKISFAFPTQTLHMFQEKPGEPESILTVEEYKKRSEGAASGILSSPYTSPKSQSSVDSLRS